MLGDDDGNGWLDRITGGSSSSIDEQEIWREVRQDGKTLNRRSQKLQNQAESLRSTESNDIADPTEMADHAQEAAEHAMNVSQGANVAVNANNETALENDEAYDVIESVQVKVEGLAEDLTDTYESVIEYGDETYQQFKDLFESDLGLGVEVTLPDEVDWESGTDVTQSLREVETAYQNAARNYRHEAKTSQNEKEKTEDRAEDYREIEEELEGSMFQEEYGEIADTLEEKADSEEPVTPGEKAEKAETYAAIAEFARGHIGDVQSAAQQISDAEEKAYQVSGNLGTLLGRAGYSRENDAGEWRKQEETEW